MNKTASLVAGKGSSARRLTRNSKLFTTILESIREKKGESIVSLDLRKIDEAVADFFILCEAQSHVQMKAIADNIADKTVEDCHEKPYHAEQGPRWTLVDYVDVVVHIFNKEDRKFYDIEGLWADAGRVEHND